MPTAVGRKLAALAAAQTAKMMGPQVTRNVAVAEEVVVQEPPAIGTAAVALVPVGKKVAHSSARRRRGPTIGCACQCVLHQGLSTTKVRVSGQLLQLAIRFGLAVPVAESVFC